VNTLSFPQKELAEAVARAGRSDAYRGRLPSNVDESSFERVPFTTKDDLRAAYPFGLLAVPQSEIATYHESSGTTGKPISSYFSNADWEDIHTRFNRNGVALSPNDLVLVKTPYALVTTAHQMHGAALRAGASVVPADNRSHNMPYARVLRLLRDLPITVAWCMPTEALLWAYAANRLKIDLAAVKLRAFVVAGEALSPAKKNRISRLWSGRRVFEDYGSTETGSLAGECVRGRVHLWSDRVHFELRDPETLEPARGNRGELVVTPLFRQAMPLVRYRMEDEVELDHAPCDCGSASPSVRVLGRNGSAHRIGEREVNSLELDDAIYSAAEECGLWFWRGRKRNDALEVEIHAEHPRLAERFVSQRVRDRLGIPVSIRSVGGEAFVPESLFRAEAPMQKPRFLFGENEEFKSLDYA
jgi:phenylacetate-CoA ligase